MKNFLRILKCPGLWVRNHSTNKKMDKFFRTLIENKDKVEILGHDRWEIILAYQNRVFSVWISNRFFAYLHRVKEHFVEPVDDDYRWYTHKFINEIEDVLPSRITQLDFYETFHEPLIPKKNDKFKFLELNK